ncbi:unnamed protein product [Effrenium voratum]|nr:unnamed protein product [Effrenium voratum]
MKFGLMVAMVAGAQGFAAHELLGVPAGAGPAGGSMSLASVAGALANIAEQPSSSPTIQSIKDYVAQMLADITTQHNVAQAELTDVSGYTTCDSTMKSTLDKLILEPTTTLLTTTVITTTQTATLHPTAVQLQECLAAVESINTTLSSCSSEYDAAKQAADAVCLNFHFKTVVDAKAEKCNETFSGSYEQFLERDVQILADYMAKKSNCSNFTELADTKAAACGQIQSSLTAKQLECSQIVVVTTTASASVATTTQVDTTAQEEAACENYHKKEEACTDYDSCYESVTLAKSAEQTAAGSLEQSRVTEWISLKRMSCLVDVLGSTDQATLMQACMTKEVGDYNTTHLALTLPTAPVKKSCGPFEKPGTCAEVTATVPAALSIAISGFGGPRLPQPLRHSLSSDGEEPWLGTGASLAAAAAAAGMAMADPSTSVPRMRLDRVQAVIQNSQSTGLFGELTVYDATERRLWDEFDELGRIDDVEALRQRDAAALRCLAALDKEIDAVGRAGRELPSALAEARAKFSSLCELVAGGAAAKSLTRIGKVEADYTKAEEDLIAASSAHQRSLARCRRLGQQAPSAEAVSTARAGLERAHLELVNEIRLAAQSAQLGLVEITGTPGLARAIRAAGPAHADPLLERLLHHSRWCERQAQHDPPAARSPLPQEPKVSSTPSRASEDAEALLERAEMRPKPGEVSPLGARSLRRGKAVVKSYGKDEKELCLQELRALLKLKTQQHVIQLLDVFKSEGLIYLEFPFCAGGSMHQWCQKVGPPLLRGDPDAFVRCLAIWRQIWQALSYIHLELVCHGDLTLDNMLLTADHHPVLTDFRCSTVAGHGPRRSLTPDYAAPELEADAAAVPSEASDVYSTGAAMAKAFLGLDLDVASCPYHPTRGQRSLPDERTDVDLADLLQHVLAENPIARPSAASVCSHRALDPSGFLRRRGLLTGQKRSPSQAFLDAAEALREEYRGRRMEDPLMFSREAVFDAIASSKVGEWREDALLGEWRVMLNEESGVDGGGLRREVVSLFFEQLESSSLVMRTGMEGSGVTTLFLNERQRADRSPQQWRQSWTAVGAMLLRALVHFGNAPLAFSSAVFDCALGRICRMPPDDAPAGEEEDVQGSIERLLKLREEKGDDWARSELLDLLRRLRREKEAGYRWMLAQRTQEERNGLSVNGLESRETIAAMLEPQSSLFLQRLGPELQGAALEWVLLWDLYLKFLGGGDRWLAYDALAEGFSAHGRRLEMWQALTGVQVVETLEGVELTAAVVLPNLEFKPGYGYETQIQYFRNVIELSMFLRFSTGIGRLPASQRFPAGQKLSIRFMPDHLEHLPSAHTCFWVVDVPPYEDQEDLAQKLRLAIAAPQPFALS